MNVIHAAGALRKFLDARERGAPERELKALQATAIAEGQNNQARAKPRGNVVDLDLARARLERSWDSAPE